MFLKRYCPAGARKAGIILAFLWMSSLGVCAQNTVIFQENFENGLGDFVIDNTYGAGYGLWHLSEFYKISLPGHTQGAALRYGREDSPNYDIGRTNRGIVKLPPIDLARYADGPIELRFKYYLEIEDMNCRWSAETDLATVEISSNGGISYVKLAKNMYLGDCFDSDLAYLNPKCTAWTECVIDLSGYAGLSIQLRFGFNTVDKSQNFYDGFYVDDIIIYGPSCNYTIAGDTNHDCVVDMMDFATMVDLVALAENWLLNCYATPDDPGCSPK